jgi:hypothetical protein
VAGCAAVAQAPLTSMVTVSTHQMEERWLACCPMLYRRRTGGGRRPGTRQGCEAEAGVRSRTWGKRGETDRLGLSAWHSGDREHGYAYSDFPNDSLRLVTGLWTTSGAFKTTCSKWRPGGLESANHSDTAKRHVPRIISPAGGSLNPPLRMGT